MSPQKTFYFREEDLKVIGELQKISDTSISQAIVTALRYYIISLNYQTIWVGIGKKRRPISFVAEKIMCEIDFAPKLFPDDPADRWSMFLTRKEKILVHWESTDAWKKYVEPWGYIDLHTFFDARGTYLCASDYAVIDRIDSKIIGVLSKEEKELPKYWQEEFRKHLECYNAQKDSPEKEFLDV